MERIKRFLIIGFILIILVSCSTVSPVVIEERPKLETGDDMTIDEFKTTQYKWAVDTIAYIEKLIAQIKNKVPYIDLKEKEKKDKK